MEYDYIREPDAIYRQSFATIRSELTLEGLDTDLAAVVTRVVHACGMPEIAADIQGSGDAIRAGRTAIANRKPILCDCRMVAAGIIADRLPARTEIIPMIAHPEAATHAKQMGNTRSAAVIDLHREQIDSAVVVIGNAPTALFRLLELIVEDGAKPALILGFPVGFVGAAESKQALIDARPTLPYVTLTGRWGGSAMASSALNAVAAGLPEDTLSPKPVVGAEQ